MYNLLHGSIYNNFVVHKKVVYRGLTVLNKIKFLKGKETRAENTKSSGKNMKKQNSSLTNKQTHPAVVAWLVERLLHKKCHLSTAVRIPLEDIYMVKILDKNEL